MRKIFQKFRSLDYRHYVSVAILLLCLTCSIFVYPNALGRVIESFRDFGLSIAFYFVKLLGIDAEISVTVNEFAVIPFFPWLQSPAPEAPLPETQEEFSVLWGKYWSVWGDLKNFKAYNLFLSDKLWIFFRFFLLVIFPLILCGILIAYKISRATNNSYGEKTIFMRFYEWRKNSIYRRIGKFFKNFVEFVKANGYYWKIFLFVWAYNLNVITIVIEAFAYYFYFVMSFDILSLYKQVYKLFVDLVPVLKLLPFAVLPLLLCLRVRTREQCGYATLRHLERKNCGFINAQPLCILVVGTMGSGKTTMLVSMALSTSTLFRNKAFELLLETDLKFPSFPWMQFERAIKYGIEQHAIYNLATARLFVEELSELFYDVDVDEETRLDRAEELCGFRPDNLLFGYDYDHEAMTYNDALSITSVWKALEDYVQLFFIYVMEEVIVANLSIRTDEIMQDIGNFPLWNCDFFRRDPRLYQAYSRHAHILDFDMLRIARTVVARNKNANVFEFGVICAQEFGKERRNALELKELKKDSIETNQKNDGFVDGLKMIRHNATVCNYPFVRILSDEQRAESLGADARDLFSVVHIEEKEEVRLTIPFFNVEEIVHAALNGRFFKSYPDYRYRRADFSYHMQLRKDIFCLIHRHYVRTYNTFGVIHLDIEVEKGILDGKKQRKKYYIFPKKDYAGRFSTDSDADFFRKRSLQSPIGLGDLEEYEGDRATWEELLAQHSYFIRDMMGIIPRT